MFWLSEAYYGLLLIPLQFPGFYYSFTPERYYGNTPFYSYPLCAMYFFPPDSLPPTGFSRGITLGNSLMETGVKRIMMPRIFQDSTSISKFNVFTGNLSRGLNAYLGNRYFDMGFYGTMGYLQNYQNGDVRNAGVLSVFRKIPQGYLTVFATTKQDAGAFLKFGYVKCILGYQDSLNYDIHLSSRIISIGLRNQKGYISGLIPLSPPLFSLYFWANREKYLISPSYIITVNLSIYAFKGNKTMGGGVHSSVLNLEVNKDMEILCGLNGRYINGFFTYKDMRISGGIELKYSRGFKDEKLAPEIRIKVLREDTLNHIDIEAGLHIIDAVVYAGIENLTGAHYNIDDKLLPDGYTRYYWGMLWKFRN